jgi:ribosomal protein S18 acetylase RimI-like enzyme
MDIVIKQLDSSLLDDFLYYFDKVAFSDNPEWSGCYCQFYHFEGKIKDWAQRTGKENREAAIKLIISEKMNGFLVYHNGNPIGWCNANSKDFYPVSGQDEYPVVYLPDIFTTGIKQQNRITNYVSEGKTASIACFLIAPEYRKKGIARKLLEFITEYYTTKDFDYIEAYPRKNVKFPYCAEGPMSLFESEGFLIYKEYDDFYIVRKELK